MPLFKTCILHKNARDGSKRGKTEGRTSSYKRLEAPRCLVAEQNFNIWTRWQAIGFVVAGHYGMPSFFPLSRD